MGEMIEGIYLREEKHRFMCTVLIDGKKEKCYVPASCKLEKLISLSGKAVWVKPIKKSNSNLKYSLYAVKSGRSWVLLNLSEANRIFGNNLYRRRFSYLGRREEIIYEKRIGNYKADIFLPDEKTVIEIKTVLTDKNKACFPSMVSRRTKEQLNEISNLLDEGFKACLIIIALNPVIKRIEVDDSVRGLIGTAMSKGMFCRGYSIRFDKLQPMLGSEVEIVL